jgi:hypothetical protein
MRVVKSDVLVATAFLLLLAPATCLAFGGKVSYPDGTPAVGAEVKLLMEVTDGDLTRNFPPPPLTMAAPPPQRGPGARKSSTVRCDGSGRFNFSEQPSGGTLVQVKAPDGKEFATVNLPAKLFLKGDAAIVLQPK